MPAAGLTDADALRVVAVGAVGGGAAGAYPFAAAFVALLLLFKTLAELLHEFLQAAE